MSEPLRQIVVTALDQAHQTTLLGRARIARRKYDQTIPPGQPNPIEVPVGGTPEHVAEVLTYVMTVCDTLKAIAIRLATEIDELKHGAPHGDADAEAQNAA